MATLTNTVVSLSISSGESISQGGVTSTPNYVHTSASANTPITNGSGPGAAQGTTSFYYTASTSTATIDLTTITPSITGGTADYSAIKAFIFENLDPTSTITLSQGTNTTNFWQGFNGTTNNYSVGLQPGGAVAAVQPATGLVVAATSKFISYIASAAAPVLRVSLVGTGTGF